MTNSISTLVDLWNTQWRIKNKGNVSPENVKRWTEKLLNVLVSSTARNKFKSYLTGREFDEGKSLLEFWEMCGSFLKKREDNLELDEQ